jgi:Pyridine nucleotide-disulphide oxidoreductase
LTGRVDVAIVGAGPYGLSIATHLRAAGIDFRIFGAPMRTWIEHMPDGMLLKSDGFASNLSDPGGALTLERFCEEQGIPYDHKRIPVSLDTFRAYGLAFQKRLVPEVEETDAVSIERDDRGFQIHLADGRTALASQVVLAVGITHFANVPPQFCRLPPDLFSHSSAHKDVGRFRDAEVTVLGAGASAIDLAIALKDAGARVTVVARSPHLKFASPPEPSPSLWSSVRRPTSPMGPGWRSRFYSDGPGLFYHLPQSVRLAVVRKHLGPGAGWAARDRFDGRVPSLVGCEILKTDIVGDRVRLTLAGPDGQKDHQTQHVIAATGYRVDLRRLTFLSPQICSQLGEVNQAPRLSTVFESSVPGLFFVGLASASSFGPMMRFACGSDWTARRITPRLRQTNRKRG